MRATIYKKPSDRQLMRGGLNLKREATKNKIKFIATFDLTKLKRIKSTYELGRFFKVNEETIRAIIKVQQEGLELEVVLPGIFIDPEKAIDTNGAFQQLKQTTTYKKLMT